MENTEKKFAIVTGASSGIGYELALQFAEHGYDLLVTAEDAGIAQATEEFKALGEESLFTLVGRAFLH